MATEEQRAALSQERGRQIAKISDPQEKKDYIRDTADIDKDYDKAANATAVKENEIKRREALSYKKGGIIPKTGTYKLHKDELVVPAHKVKKMMDTDLKEKMAAATMGLAKPAPKPRQKKAVLHMNIMPTDNKGYYVTHQLHREGMPTGKAGHFSLADSKALHDHVTKHYPHKEKTKPEEGSAEALTES